MNRIATLFLVIALPIFLLAFISQQIAVAQPLISDPHNAIPEADALLVSGIWQAEANVLEAFAFTMTIQNNTALTMTDLLVTATVPANATHVSGGTLMGNEVQQTIATLSPGCCETTTFFFTATQPIGTSSYGLTGQNERGGLTAFTDGFQENWNNWSWATATTVTSSVVYTGLNALAVEHTGAFGGLFFAVESNIAADDLSALRFWIHGGSTGGQDLGARLERPDGSITNEVVIGTTANLWNEISIPIDDFGVVTDVTGIVIQSRLPSTQAVYYVDEVGLVPAQSQSGVTTTNVLLPALAITKEAPLTASTGEQFTYTISVSNQGPGLARNLVVSDVLPVGATYIGGGNLVGNTVELTITSIAAGVTETVQFSVSATQTVVNNDYQVIADGGFSASGSTPVTTTITPPVLALSKRGPMNVTAGSNFPYQIRVVNSGTTPATNLVITDTIPAGTTYQSGGSHSSGVVSWTVPLLTANSAVTVTMVVSANTPDSYPASVINDDYAVVADGGYSAVGANAVTTNVLGSQLSLTKDGPAQVDLGEVFTYTLTITNSGTLTATNLILVDQLPDGTIYQGGGISNGTSVTFTIPLVSPGNTITRTFTVVPDPATAPLLGTLFNDTYALTYGNGNIITGTDTVSTTVAFPILNIDKSGPSEVTAGDPIVYELSLGNSGLMDASTILVTDTLPAGATFVSADNLGTLNGSTVEWNLLNLGAGITTTLRFTVTADTTIINSDYGAESEFAAATGSNAVTTIVGSAGFTLFLPIVTSNADGSEPNDSCSEAHPLNLNRRYNFHPDDMNDFYTFALSSAANLDIFLTNFTPIAGQIVLYSAPDCSSLQFIASNGDFSETKTINAGVQPAGTYLIWVINDGPLSSSQMYSLEVSSP